MRETTALFGLDVAVTFLWFIAAWLSCIALAWLALVALPWARGRLRKPHIDWGEGMSVEALQRLQRVLWEEDEMERRKR